MTRKRARLYGVLLLLTGAGVATALTLVALKENVAYFRTPTEIVTGNYPERKSGRSLRIGGLVEKGSLQREGDSIHFRVTDLVNSLTVRFHGVPPDLFREGQGVVADGKVEPDGTFNAERILAKHDEKYMPPEITKALKDAKASQPASKP